MKVYDVISKFRTLRQVFAQRRVILADGKKWADPFCEVFDTLVDTERARQDAYFERKSTSELMIRQLKMSSLINFWKELVGHFGWQNMASDLDGWDFEEMAEKHGLIRKEEYDRERHGDIDSEEGDIIWFDNFDIDADDSMMAACAAIIGFTGMPSDKPLDREWVLRTALKGFGCDSLEEYIEKVKFK